MSHDDHYGDVNNEETHLLKSGDTENGLGKPSVDDNYRSRWISIRLIYMTSFMNCVSFTVTLASLWSYLKVLEPDAQTTTLGLVVSAYAMGQIISGPMFGFWSNRRSVKEPLVISLFLNLVTYVFYMYLANLPDHRGYYMIAARWLIGFSSGTPPLSRAYIADATTLSERTSAVANTNIYGAVGFIIGPLLQAALVPISYPGPVESKAFHFNMYTAPILVSAALCLINVVVIILAFKEHSVKEVAPPGLDTSGKSYQDASIDYLAAFSCIVLYFSCFLNFAFLETITMPLIMDMFAWTKARATLIQSIVIGGTALLSILVYVVIKVLSTRMREKTLLLWGFIISMVSYLILLPWGNDYPKIQMADLANSTVNNTLSTFSENLILPSFPQMTSIIHGESFKELSQNESSTSTGCPWQYEWCQTVPALQLPQYVIGMFMFGIGFPISNVLTISIFSKILGPKPMGLWMGCLIASGCVSGIIGPIFQSMVYDNYGPRITSITLAAFMLATIILVLSVFRRLRPFAERHQKMEQNTSINKN